MDLRDFAEKLSSEPETAAIVQMLRELPPHDASRLATELRNVCYENWNSEPTKAQGAAKAAAALANLHPEPRVRAAEAWIRGIALRSPRSPSAVAACPFTSGDPPVRSSAMSAGAPLL